MLEEISLWLVLALGFTAGNLVYWLTWKAEQQIREKIRERKALEAWMRGARS